MKKRNTAKVDMKKINVSLDEFKSRIKTADINSFFIFGSIILVLFIGLYAIFSPDTNNPNMTNPACGKIVIAADGPSLRSNVAPSLTSASYFLVVNPLSQKLMETAKNPYQGVQTQNADIAYLIAGKGEEAVIAGSINQTNYKVLSQFGIKGFGGYHGNVKDAVDLYRQARISQGTNTTPGPNQQVAFGFGKQHFICPTCNWHIEAAQKAGNFPNCPNCGSPMATEMNRTNMNTFLKNQFNQAEKIVPVAGIQPMPQSKMQFWQGPETTGYFICPTCNWRSYSQRDLGQYPQCPNCKTIMARGGAYQQNYAPSPAFNIQSQQMMGATPVGFRRNAQSGTCILR